MNKDLARGLNGHLANRRWSFEKLADATGLPRNTVYRWTRGEVSKVRHWQDLAKAARALGLNRLQVNSLLEAGQHASIEVLLERSTDDEDRALLAPWMRSPPNNLPQPLTSFVGRADELERITRLLFSARLVTLTGSGGSGKTRLAIEAAHTVLDEFDGAFFIDLAAICDPESVILTISQTLGLRESLEESPLSTLITHLRDSKLLLVLDNFEHVIEAGTLVTKLLGGTRRVKAIVTSRTRLNVSGEHVVDVPPLELPNPDAVFDDLSRNPAVALFAARALTADASFVLDQGNAALVAGICVHMEGLPLGIELAAARTRHMGLRSMLDRFPGRLELAGGGPRDVHDRQRTLRATMAWSYDLLAPDEQSLFRCLGVFAGGFTEDAARAVFAAFVGADSMSAPCGHHQPGLLLESLADHSLLQRNLDAGDDLRYEMLETIREFALEKMKEQGDLPSTQQAHAGYYLELAERMSPERDGQARHTQALAMESDNVRSALAWCRDRGEQETGLRLCVALMPHWHVQDHQREARAWLETFMADGEHLPPKLRARGELWQGLQLLRGAGAVEPASHHFQAALDLFRHHGDLIGVSEVKQAIGDAHRLREEWAQARLMYEESLVLSEQTGNAYIMSHSYMGLAFCAQEIGRFDEAQRNWELVLEWTRRANNQPSETLALNSLGEMARQREDWREAEDYYQQSLVLARELDSDFRKALALHNLGYVALARGDKDQAIAQFTESLVLYQRQEYRKGQAECLAGLGRVEAVAGEPERAARLCGASETILMEMGTQLDTLDRAAYQQTLATLQSQLGERLEALLDEGRAMPIERAVEYAVPNSGPESVSVESRNTGTET